MAVIATGLLEKGLRSEFYSRFQATPVYWPDLCTRIPSTSDHEHYRFLGSVPAMREWGQGRLAKGLRSESYSVENLKYEGTIEVDRDEISDDQTGQIRQRVMELAEYARTHPDVLLEELLANGHQVGYNAYDGFSFFNEAHVSGDSGAQSNVLTATVADADKVTVAEFRSAFAASVAAMISFRDDRGSPLRLQPRPEGFVVVVPPPLYFVAMDALGIPITPTTDGLSRNVLQGAASRIFPFGGLSDSYSWFLCKTDRSIKPFIYQDREPVEFGSVAEGSEEAFKREKFLYGVRARYRVTFGYWQYCCKITFQAQG